MSYGFGDGWALQRCVRCGEECALEGMYVEEVDDCGKTRQTLVCQSCIDQEEDA